MVFTDVNNTYVRVKESDKKIFYIKKSEAKKTFLKGDFISIIGDNGSEIYKVGWRSVDVYDESTSSYTVQNSDASAVTKPSQEETLVAVHNAFFFTDGVGIDIEQLSNVDGTPADGYILVYDSAQEKWVVSGVDFDTANAADLTSNVSGLQRGRLQRSASGNLLFNDVSGVQHTINLPSGLTSTGDVSKVSVDAVNDTSSAIAAGTPVHFTGSLGNSGSLKVIESDASIPATMPAGGIMTETVSPNGNAVVAIIGAVSELNTKSITNGGIVETSTGADPIDGDDLYVKAGGGLTTVKPISSSHLVQKIGAVENVNGSVGKIMVLGAGRTNDVPNLANQNVFIGTAASGTESRQLTADDIDDSSSTSKFFTNLLARASVQAESGSKITFDSATGNIGIDDSAYLQSVTSAQIIAAINDGEGIEITGGGVVSVRLKSGGGLSFDATSGEIELTDDLALASDVPDNADDLSDVPAKSGGTAGQVLALKSDLSAFEYVDQSGGEEFTSTITFNIPDKNNTKRSFGRYLHNDTIGIGGSGEPTSMTVKEVLQSAFSEPTAPTPGAPTTNSEIEFNQTTGISIVLSLNFGIENAGSTGSGVLYYRLRQADSWTPINSGFTPSFGNDTATFTHNIAGTVAYNTLNKFQYYIETTDGGLSTDSSVLTVGYESFELPTFHNANITRTSNTSSATGTSGTLREVGDVQSTVKVRVRRNAAHVAMDKLYLQVKIASTWETIPSTEIDVSGVADGNYSSYSTLTMTSTSVVTSAATRDLSTDTSIEFRGVVTSDSPGTSNDSNFSIINSRYAFIICFDDDEGASQSDMHTIISNFGGDNNGEKRRAITDTSGGASGYTFPSPLNYDGNSRTPGFDTTSTQDYLYFIYPGGSTAITQILAGGTANVSGAFNDATNTNVTSFTYTNPYGKSNTYQVHRSNVVGSFTGDYLQIT